LAVDVDIDVAVLKSEIQKTYASVSAEPERDFIFRPGGRGQKTLATRASLRTFRMGPSSPSRG